MTDTYWGLPDPDRQAEFYADVPMKRLMAWVIDSALILAISVAIVLLSALTALFFVVPLFLVVSFVYRYVTLANRSATPGMRMMAIEFRSFRGERLDNATAFLHTLGYSVSMACVLPQVISVALMLTGPRGQSLTDLVLGTAAINRAA